jgi:hypothetical protein
MNIEQELQSVIEKKLEDGTITKAIEEEFEKSIRNSVDDLFSRYGDVTKVLKKKIEDVMVERIENQDFSKYLVKMDSLLSEFVEQAMGENLKLAENFKGLLLDEKIEKISLSAIFEKWMKYVAENVDTDGLEVDYDDGLRYEEVGVSLSVEIEDEKSWSSFRYASVYFECEHDESMNLGIRMWKYRSKWEIYAYGSQVDIRSLRGLRDLDILIMRLEQDSTKIEMDTEFESEFIVPEKEPEASYQ